MGTKQHTSESIIIRQSIIIKILYIIHHIIPCSYWHPRSFYLILRSSLRGTQTKIWPVLKAIYMHMGRESMVLTGYLVSNGSSASLAHGRTSSLQPRGKPAHHTYYDKLPLGIFEGVWNTIVSYADNSSIRVHNAGANLGRRVLRSQRR